VNYLLDTNVVSEVHKPVRNPGVVDWLEATLATEQFISVLTVGELHRGVTRLRNRGDHAQAETVERFAGDTEQQFAERILPVTTDVAVGWARQPLGATIPPIDALIAATANVCGMTVVTRNVKNFEPTGARLVNPFIE
jgi:predicted nucleic acid-binding protein